MAEPRRVVRILVAAGETEHALPDEFFQSVPDLARLAAIGDSPGQRCGQPDPVVERLEQQGAAVGGRVRLVERRLYRAFQEVWKKNGLSARIIVHWAPWDRDDRAPQADSSDSEGLGVSGFVNNPG